MAGNNGNGADNLLLGRSGGDRYADKKMIMEKIRDAMAPAFSEPEVRRFYGKAKDAEVTDLMRLRMAKAKARPVYEGMIEAFKAAASETLGGSFWGWDGEKFDWIETKGLNFGGVLRLGMVPKTTLRVIASNEGEGDLKEAGVTIYKRPLPPNGVYVVTGTSGPPGHQGYKAEMMAAGWKDMDDWPRKSGGGWFGAVYWGPIEGGVIGQQVTLPYPPSAGGAAAFSINNFFQNSIDVESEEPYCWCFVDPLSGLEKRVHWVNQQVSVSGRRLKAEILETFWCELNGVVP